MDKQTIERNCNTPAPPSVGENITLFTRTGKLNIIPYNSLCLPYITYISASLLLILKFHGQIMMVSPVLNHSKINEIVVTLHA